VGGTSSECSSSSLSGMESVTRDEAEVVLVETVALVLVEEMEVAEKEFWKMAPVPLDGWCWFWCCCCGGICWACCSAD